MNNHSSFIYNLKNILLSIFILIISENCFCQSGWIQQFSGTTMNLYSVKFANSNTGWCVGNDGVILKTTNGGTNWIAQMSGFSINLSDVSFPSVSIGYSAGDSGVILKTVNGGTNWIRLNINRDNNFNAVFFVNETLGYVGGYNSISWNQFYRTFNGGSNWDSTQFNPFIKDIFFINSNTGWIVSETKVISGSQVSKTTDSGFSWSNQFSSNLYINAIFFIDTLNGWFGAPRAVLGVPNIYRTTNGGENWIPTPPWSGSEINSIFFVSKSKGYAVGPQRIIQFTTDGGVTWLAQTYNTNGMSHNSVYFADSLTGWVVGDSGVILKTTTGGVITGFSNASSEIPDEYFLSQNYPNPFNPSTNLGFGISKLGFVSLKVYDVLGNEVANLVNENKPAGSYEVEFDGSNYASGIFFYRLEVNGNHIDTKRMILLK